MRHFTNSNPNIINNTNLRDPQKEAYIEMLKFFNVNPMKERKEALIQLPTGTGKTGLMAIAPYGIAKKRVLIITPQTIVRDTVLGSLDGLDPKNFWLFSKVFEYQTQLPAVIEYNKKITKGTLELADIVILNVHKLQERLQSSLLKVVPKDFFDLIIIDEAHHSEAHTWKKAIENFEFAHVIKVTGTPFRSDGKLISGDNIYKYPLSKAMANGYVKSLEKFHLIPDIMTFTLDGDDTKIYTLEQIKALKLKDLDWISRKVALSVESNLSVIKKSIEFLHEKRQKTNNHPHKIVAVACSIDHARQLKKLYEDEGMNVAIVHSEMEKGDLEKEFQRIDTHKVEVVVNVALLGEGYDHKFLSIAAIFRPFRSDLPYQQFIGRTLRSISTTDVDEVFTEDNIAQLVYHKELNLENLWESYKKEIVKKDIIKRLREEKKADYVRTTEDSTYVSESAEYFVAADTFLETELIKKRAVEEQEELSKIKKLMDTLNVSEEMAQSLLLQSKVSKDKKRYLRPDLAQAELRSQFDKKIKEDIIPSFLAELNLELDGQEIYNCRDRVFPLKSRNYYYPSTDNGGCLAVFFNTYFKNMIGAGRDYWEIENYEEALLELDDLQKHVYGNLKKLF
ncbi:DEAD/DEAH box helicase [Lysinibacillus fusiformis]|uniref:DEAD/DEAH box helicase n=1 Tax=Lysinibacillus fusiformis TaxID=28031 RepID=UPI00355639D6